MFWGAAKRQMPWIITGLVMTVIGTVLVTLGAQATRDIVDKGIVERTEPIGPIARRLIILSIIGFFTGVTGKLISARVEYTLERDLRNLLYLRLHRTKPEALNRFSTGQVVTRSLADLQTLKAFIQSILGIVGILPLLLGYSLFILFQSPILWTIGSLGLAVDFFLVNKIRRRLWGYSYLRLDQLSRITSAIDEPVRGVRVMKWFGREQYERAKVAKAAERNYKYILASERFRAKYDMVFRVAPTVVRFLVLLVGARLVLGGSVTIGEFTLLFSYVTATSQLASFLDSIVGFYQYMKTGAGRLNEVLKGGPRLEKRQFLELPERSNGLEIHGATVQLSGFTAVRDVSLTAEPGTLTIVTGPPGSGKSMVAGLAAGSIAPTSGTVLLDGTDVQRVDPDELRTAVHLVSEEPFLFGRTIRENLLLGVSSRFDPEANTTDDALLAALNAAGAREVLDTLGGSLDAAIGDRGLTLSGGQRQRLALARALVERPRLLVLDDALSAVSPTLEVDIVNQIRAFAPETAILAVGRRESLAQIADAVVTLPEPDAAPVGVEVGVGDTELADAMSSIHVDRPYDDRLVEIVSGIQLTNDEPRIPLEVASADERVGFLRIMRPVRNLVAGVSALVVLNEIIDLVPTYLIGDAIDNLERGKEAKDAGNLAASAQQLSAVDKIALATLGIAVVLAAVTFVRRITLAKATNNMLYLLRVRIFSRITRLGVSHFDRELPGTMSTRVVHDMGVVQRFADDIIPDLLRSVLTLVLTFGIITYLVPSLAPMIFLFAVIVGIGTWAQMPIANKLFAKERLALGDVVARFQEDFAGRHIISGFGAERRARLGFGRLTANHRDRQRGVEILRAFFGEGLEVVRDVCIALVYLRAGNLVLAGVLTTGTVITVRLYLSEAMRPIPLLARYWQGYLNARISLRQIEQLWDTQPYPIEKDDAVPVNELEGAIKFDNVTFTYPGTTRPVVHNVTFDVAPGDRVAIVGHTGAGKSSIAKLLGRIYDPDAGRVLVDDIDIREFEQWSYRQRIGVVPQEAFLFKGTVASNIGYAKPDATREEIENAARLAGVYDTLADLEGNFDAKVEEEGRNLTAAVRQLIALARAVLAAPDILVLDEATSSLDAATEAEVVDAIFELGITTVLVTHRLPLAERADFVVMLDEGRIIEAGSHAELVEAGGAYPKLWAYSLSTSPNGSTRRRRRAAREAAADAEAPSNAARPRKPAKKAAKSAKAAAKRSTRNGKANAVESIDVVVDTKKPRNGTTKKVVVSAKKAAAKANGGRKTAASKRS